MAAIVLTQEVRFNPSVNSIKFVTKTTLLGAISGCDKRR